MNIFFYLAVAFFIVNIVFIKKRRLDFGYSFLWTTISIIIVILSFDKYVLRYILKIKGIFYMPESVMIIVFGIVLLMFFHFTIVLSDVKKRIARLTQENALLNDKINERLK